jgi:hypothetical protein
MGSKNTRRSEAYGRSKKFQAKETAMLVKVFLKL